MISLRYHSSPGEYQINVSSILSPFDTMRAEMLALLEKHKIVHDFGLIKAMNVDDLLYRFRCVALNGFSSTKSHRADINFRLLADLESGEFSVKVALDQPFFLHDVDPEQDYLFTQYFLSEDHASLVEGMEVITITKGLGVIVNSDSEDDRITAIAMVAEGAHRYGAIHAKSKKAPSVIRDTVGIGRVYFDRQYKSIFLPINWG